MFTTGISKEKKEEAADNSQLIPEDTKGVVCKFMEEKPFKNP